MGDSSRRFGSQDNLLSMGDDDRGVDPAPPAPRRRTSNSDATNGANGRSASNGRPRGVRANPREPLLHPQNGARGQPVNSQPRYTPEEVEELRRRRLAEIEQIEQELELKYGAESVLALIKPVSVCMIVVIATIRSVAYFSTNDTQFVYTPYESNNPNASNSEKFGGAILNALIIIGIVVGMTCVLLLLYKYRCYKAIHGWLLLSSLLLLFFFSYQFVDQVLRAYNSTLDWITMVVSIWNFGVVGLICIHWKGPLLLQQVYLVAVSALMALVLIKNLPDWTTWVVLAAIAIYDLVAVLSPCGPLKALVETAQERDEPLFPALIYSSTMAWIVNMADTGERTQTQSTSLTNGAQTQPQQQQQQQQRGGTATSSSSHGHHRRRSRQSSSSPNADDVELLADIGGSPAPNRARTAASRPPANQGDDEEHTGVKLGLGDFIFYSVLVGKAATADKWTTIAACYVGILIGLACTLLLLSIFRKALPALPISIAFGLVFYFATSEVLDPLINQLNDRQVFI
ncbi:presenilin-2 CTF subunit [Salpingoeca rosetta]|uniref:Presenilin n=1 Tax=Salpingoeca rosetta (strain ATCC 50818 / BSB-021) TaxID=946362 RepID=F2TYS0_SALR5|nr:presenilin-2 CTF subunit [Salpingoeca rosetta]EGD78744.1 presenilin-2 CTF subunit [Salpingoeca rosetta]|eukprot:XP_004997701.1 presenilin-2 CTF subunit [Salpingoeca rosetta]